MQPNLDYSVLPVLFLTFVKSLLRVKGLDLQ